MSMLSAAANRTGATRPAAANDDMTPPPPAPTEGPLYAGRVPVYPRAVKGPVRRVKWAVLVLCLLVYYLAPWLRWDRGPGHPSQALLIDLPTRRGYFFGIEIWPQEVYYLAGLLILGALALFFVTSLFGRLWCGFTCPQTVWTDLFLLTERLIEGDRAVRVQRDRARWTGGKIARKLLKHALWLVIALVTGGAWVMYFHDAPTLVRDLVDLRPSEGALFFIGLFTTTTYLLAGWAREQVCTYMCPWPRFQSAMVDRNTLTVMYREWRGEPRGKIGKGGLLARRGDCIDCRSCVHVCPMGIDIRDGLQLPCIGCGLCIDACDRVMRRLGRPTGLIAFTSQAMREAAKAPGGSTRADLTRTMHAALLRPRTAVYSVLLIAGASLMLWSLLSRSDFSLSILADRSPLFVQLSDGSIRNAYTIKIANKHPEARRYVLRITGLKGSRLKIAGVDEEAAAAHGVTLTVPPDSVGSFRALVHAPPGSVHGEVPLAVVLRPTDGREKAITDRAEFHGPRG
jgi:cytochrome c oxidase accessory protein FixG